MTNEEFDHASGIVEETNDLAMKLYPILKPDAPRLPLREKLYGHQSDYAKRMAWDLACESVRHHTDDDPELSYDQVMDELNAQTDPCQAAKEADLAA